MQIELRLKGSAEEINEALQALTSTAALQTAAKELGNQATPAMTKTEGMDAEMTFVTTKFACRALTRLPLSKPFKEVLKALSEAHPDWLSLPTLHSVAGYRPPQFAGLMGAFGRRMANTDGFASEAYFFESRWNDNKSTWDYRLPDSVREALDLEQLV